MSIPTKANDGRIPKIRFFNPSRLTDAELEASFVARQTLFEKIHRQITNEKRSSIPQHHLIIGQRGMGKTTMLCRLATELRKPSYKDKFIPLQFPEEQYVGIDRLSKFWLNCLDSLADALETGENRVKAASLDNQIRAIENQKEEEGQKADSALRLLIETAAELDQRIVLLIDNINSLFQRLKDNAHDLRAFLMRDGAPVLVGAATVMPEEAGNYNEAFYDAFKIRVLYNLSLSEMTEVIVKLAEATGQPDLITNIQKETPRLAVLRDLTGGNPRTTTLLFELFSRGFSENPYEDLEGILDLITPLYQSRLGELPDQGQLVVGYLAQHWSPAGAAEVTENVNLPRGSISTQLGRLEMVGLVEKVELSKGKRPGYQIAERFFNIWYLMRFATRRRRNDLECLTHFLSSFYTRDERIERANAFLKKQSLSSEALTYALALADSNLETSIAYALRSHAETLIVRQGRGIRERISKIMNPDDIPDRIYTFEQLRQQLIHTADASGAAIDPEEFASLVIGSFSLLPPNTPNRNLIATHPLRSEEVLAIAGICEKEIEDITEASSAEAVDEIRGYLIQGQLLDMKDEEGFIRMIETTQTSNGQLLIGELASLVDTKIKISAYNRAVEIDSENFEGWNILAKMLEDDPSSIDQAEIAYRKAIELKPKCSTLWNDFGNFLSERTEKYDEALDAYDKAISLDPNYALPWNGLGNLQYEHFNKPADAERAFRNSIKIDSNYASPWNGLANLLRSHHEKFNDAKEAYKKCISIDENYGHAYFGLGNLSAENLGHYSDAEYYYRKAIEITPDLALPHVGLGILLADRMGEIASAEDEFLKATELEPGHPDCWLFYGKFMAEHQRNFEGAFDAYKKLIAIDPNCQNWNIIGNLSLDYLGNLDYAKTAYQNAIATCDDDFPIHNMIMLHRDFLDDPDSALREIAQIEVESLDPEIRELGMLQCALFASRQNDWSSAKTHLSEALAEIGEQFPATTRDDWYRTTAVLLHQGYGNKLVTFLEKTGWNKRFMPWFEAIKSHVLEDSRYLLDIPQEARAVAEEIFYEITIRRKWLPNSTRDIFE